jgi:hypothetical protein
MRSFFNNQLPPGLGAEIASANGQTTWRRRSADLFRAIDVPENQPNRGDIQPVVTQYLTIVSECAATHADIADGFAFKPI